MSLLNMYTPAQVSGATAFVRFHSGVAKHPKLTVDGKAGYIAALVFTDRNSPRALQEMSLGDLVPLLVSVLP
jgi:hypothetical protein